MNTCHVPVGVYSQICVSSQDMSSAVITSCGHFFHDNCLRKWLYVQETCPMCHQPVRPIPPGQSQASGDRPGPAAAAQRDAWPDVAAQQGHQNVDNSTTNEMQRENVACDSILQQNEESCRNREDEDEAAELDSEAAQSNTSSSSGDFIFVSPVETEDLPPSQTLHTSQIIHSHGEVNGSDSPVLSVPAAVSENTTDVQSGPELHGFKNAPPRSDHMKL